MKRKNINFIFLLFSTLLEAKEVEFCHEDNFKSLEPSVASIANHFFSNLGNCKKTFDDHAGEGKHHFDLKFCEDGRYVLNLRTYFPNAQSVESVFTDYFLNPTNIQKTSHLLQSSAPKVWLNNKVFYGKADNLKEKTYQIETHPRKSFIERNFFSDCKLSPAKEYIVQRCTLSMSRGDGKEFFSTTEKNSSNIECRKAPVGVTCKIILSGRPLGISGLLYSNTAEKLAVSGAFESMKDVFNLSYLSLGCDPGINFEGTKEVDFYIKNLETFWPRTTSMVDKLKGSNSSVNVQSSRAGLIFQNLNTDPECN